MKNHHLKTHSPFFEEVESGRKPFEIRKNDRNFCVGDKLVLESYNPDTDEYTGRRCVRYVTCVTDFEQKEGYVVLGLSPFPCGGVW